MITSHRILGQAITELILSLHLLIVLVSGAAWVLHAAWERGKCTYLVFERTRAALTAAPGPLLLGPVDYEETSGEVVSRASCGQEHEQVGFKKLELMHKWN